MKKTIKLTLKIGAGLFALFILLGANCITSGNVLIIIDDLGPINASHSGTLDKEQVNLKEISDWSDHKDDLLAIDDIGFACKITNNSVNTASGQAYISDKEYANPTTVRANAVLILDGISIPAGETKEIEWQESYDYLQNFDKAKEIILNPDEIFHVYFIAEEAEFSITVFDIVLFLSVNGKP